MGGFVRQLILFGVDFVGLSCTTPPRCTSLSKAGNKKTRRPKANSSWQKTKYEAKVLSLWVG